MTEFSYHSYAKVIHSRQALTMADKSHPGRRLAQLDRDAALRRVGRVRGLTILGAGALTAALAGVVSAVAPGHTLRGKTAVAARPGATAAPGLRRASSTPRLPPPAVASQLGLQAPGSAPQAPAAAPAPQAQPAPTPVAPQPAAPSSGGVVSGGS